MSKEAKPRKIAIVGASNIGLMCLRFMSRKGHDITCFEQRPKIGGMWNFETTPKDKERGYGDLNPDGSTSCAYSQLCLNTSKYVFFNSDVLNDNLDLYQGREWLTADEFLQQQNYWVEKYNLMPFIRLNTKVLNIKKRSNGWTVISNHGDKISEQEFDFVILATGGFRYAKISSYENVDKFQGISIHSSQVRLEDKLFRNKNVLVVGGNFSGVDMVCSAAKFQAKNVYWSETRNLDYGPHWLIDRCPASNPAGSNPKQPFDTRFNRYIWFDRPDLLQERLNSICVPLHESNKGINVTLPNDNLGVTDVPYLFEQVKSGKIQKLGPLKSINKNGAIMKSGRVLDDLDIIVSCTGFYTKYPVLDEYWSEEQQARNELYYHLFPADDTLQGVVILGTCDAKAELASFYELQIRWLCKFWLTRDYDSEGRIFTKEEISRMKEIIQQIKAEKEAVNLHYKVVENHYGLFDMLAEEIGCLPPDYRELIAKGTKEDVELGVALMKGPVYSMQYRLQGDDAYQNVAEFLIKVAKKQIGEEEFNSSVKRAMADSKEFFKSHGIVKDHYVVERCFPRAIHIE